MPSLINTLINGLGQQARTARTSRQQNREEALSLLQAGFVPEDSPLAAQLNESVQQPAQAPTEEIGVGEPNKFNDLEGLLKQTFFREDPLDASSFVPSVNNPQVAATLRQREQSAASAKLQDDQQAFFEEKNRLDRKASAQEGVLNREVQERRIKVDERANELTEQRIGIDQQRANTELRRVENEAARIKALDQTQIRKDQIALSKVLSDSATELAKITAEGEKEAAKFNREGLIDRLGELDTLRARTKEKYGNILGFNLPSIKLLAGGAFADMMQDIEDAENELIQANQAAISRDADASETDVKKANQSIAERVQDDLHRQAEAGVIGSANVAPLPTDLSQDPLFNNDPPAQTLEAGPRQLGFEQLVTGQNQ